MRETRLHSEVANCVFESTLWGLSIVRYTQFSLTANKDRSIFPGLFFIASMF